MGPTTGKAWLATGQPDGRHYETAIVTAEQYSTMYSYRIQWSTVESNLRRRTRRLTARAGKVSDAIEWSEVLWCESIQDVVGYVRTAISN